MDHSVHNVAVGSEALKSNTLSGANTAVGYQALRSFTAGRRASSRPDGPRRSVFKLSPTLQALVSLTVDLAIKRSEQHHWPEQYSYRFLCSREQSRGDNNTADGWIALQHNTTGGYNTAVGVNALGDNISGTYNIAVGYQAGQGLTTGSNNIYIGGVAGGGNEGQSNTITIGGTPDQYLHCRYKRHGARRWKSGFRRGRWSPRCGDFVAALQGKHPAYGQA